MQPRSLNLLSVAAPRQSAAIRQQSVWGALPRRRYAWDYGFNARTSVGRILSTDARDCFNRSDKIVWTLD